MYLPTTKEYDKYWGIDIEGDGFIDTVSVVWCATAKNVGTGVEKSFRDYKSLLSFVQTELAAGCFFIAHNGIEYDFPALNRIVGTRYTIRQTIDTMVMSMVYSPSLAGGHSLEAWGNRLRFRKGEWNDFSKYSPEMEEYCMNDTRLLVLLFKALVERMRQSGFSEEGLEIEHRSWELVRQQRKNGFAFNIEEANLLYAKLRGIENDIAQRIYQFWPPKLERVKSFTKAYKADGTPTTHFRRHSEQFVKLELHDEGGGYDAYDYVYFNIGSPPQRVEKLLAAGWVPYEDEYTAIKGKTFRDNRKGSPTPTKKGKLVPSLEKFVNESGKEEVRLIAKWLEINGRANMINTWIEAYNDNTKCIHGRVWLANTLRYRHSNPNTANIPAVRLDGHDPIRGEDGAFTYEARDLWTVRAPERVLVGVDAKGIQLRVLAHYLNNPEFIKEVLSGDPHSYNQRIGGFETRPIAKTFLYAYLLGAGEAKVTQITGQPGKVVKSRFENNFPGLKDLLDNLLLQVDRTGRIILCDGTPLLVAYPHTRLGYLLQGDESRIMKKAMIYVAQEVRKQKIDSLQVGFIHDELQYDVREGDVDRFKDVCLRAFNRAGEAFSYRIPIDGDVSIGTSWAQSH